MFFSSQNLMLNGLKILWDLNNLIILETGFEMGQILWDFISVWDMACMKYGCVIEKCPQKV